MRDLLDRLSSFPQRLTLATEGAAESSRHLPERDGGWSVADVIAHLGDLELVYAVRIRTIVAGAGETPLAALDQNAWVERVHRRETVAELLENFALLSRLTEEELDRGGIHPQYGPITVRAAAERLVNHDEKHLAQIERIKAAV
jgi:phage/plasmid-associated DNA primase